jgi:hypothetical protein
MRYRVVELVKCVVIWRYWVCVQVVDCTIGVSDLNRFCIFFFHFLSFFSLVVFSLFSSFLFKVVFSFFELSLFLFFFWAGGDCVPFL